MAKTTVKRNAIKTRKSGVDPLVLQRFAETDGEARNTTPTVRNVRSDSVDVEARTLTAVAVTGTPRTIGVYSEDLDAWLDVEEVIDVAGMDFSRVATGMQFLDNHNSWEREAILGVVTEAHVEDVPDVGPGVVVDVLISSRTELDSVLQDLADGILGCISCQYTVDESTLEIRDGMLPLLTVTKSTLLEVSLVSVPADPNSLVRSEGKPTMAKTTVTAARTAAAAKRAAAAARKRSETGADGAVDEAAIAAAVETAVAEVVEEAVAIAVDAAVAEIVEEIAADGGEAVAERARAAREAGAPDDETEEERAKREEEEAKDDEENPVRSMVRSLLGKRGMLGSRSAQQGKPDVTKLRSMAEKYGVKAEFEDMLSIGTPMTELRSFVVNATASRSGTGPTHDGRDTGQRSGANSRLVGWGETNIGKRAAQRASKR